MFPSGYLNLWQCMEQTGAERFHLPWPPTKFFFARLCPWRGRHPNATGLSSVPVLLLLHYSTLWGVLRLLAVCCGLDFGQQDFMRFLRPLRLLNYVYPQRRRLSSSLLNEFWDVCMLAFFVLDEGLKCISALAGVCVCLHA